MAIRWDDVAEGEEATPASINDRLNAIRKGDVYNVKAYGATGDGTTDDKAAIASAITAATDGATLYFPPGQYRIASNLTCDKALHWRGAGPSSAIIVDVASASIDGVTFNSHVSANLYRLSVKDVAFLGTTTCRYGVVFNRCHIGEFDIHVKCAAAQEGTLVNGCLMSRWRIVTSVNFTYPYSASMPTRGFLAKADTTNSISTNANEFFLIMENAIAKLSDGAGQGNNLISGTIEGCGSASPALTIEDCVAVHIQNLHLEANTGNDLKIDGCSNVQVGPGLWTDGVIELDGCWGVDLDGVTTNSVTLTGTNYRVTTGVLHYNVLGTGTITDSNSVICQRLPIANISNQGTPASFDAETVPGEVPNVGTYIKGAFVDNYNPVVRGAASSQYIITGWKRLTNGSNHVLGTDWVQIRTLTGT
jgi:hypothetical protein